MDHILSNTRLKRGSHEKGRNQTATYHPRIGASAVSESEGVASSCVSSLASTMRASTGTRGSEPVQGSHASMAVSYASVHMSERKRASTSQSAVRYGLSEQARSGMQAAAKSSKDDSFSGLSAIKPRPTPGVGRLARSRSEGRRSGADLLAPSRQLFPGPSAPMDETNPSQFSSPEHCSAPGTRTTHRDSPGRAGADGGWPGAAAHHLEGASEGPGLFGSPDVTRARLSHDYSQHADDLETGAGLRLEDMDMRASGEEENHRYGEEEEEEEESDMTDRARAGRWGSSTPRATLFGSSGSGSSSCADGPSASGAEAAAAAADGGEEGDDDDEDEDWREGAGGRHQSRSQSRTHQRGMRGGGIPLPSMALSDDEDEDEGEEEMPGMRGVGRPSASASSSTGPLSSDRSEGRHSRDSFRPVPDQSAFEANETTEFHAIGSPGAQGSVAQLRAPPTPVAKRVSRSHDRDPNGLRRVPSVEETQLLVVLETGHPEDYSLFRAMGVDFHALKEHEVAAVGPRQGEAGSAGVIRSGWSRSSQGASSGSHLQSARLPVPSPSGSMGARTDATAVERRSAASPLASGGHRLALRAAAGGALALPAGIRRADSFCSYKSGHSGISAVVRPALMDSMAPSARASDVTVHPMPQSAGGFSFNECFEQLGVLGEGAFSVVYAARAKANGVVYAVKRSRDRMSSAAERKRNMREFFAAQRAGPHPRLTRYIAAWQEQGHLFYCEEMCPKGSLKDVEALVAKGDMRGAVPEEENPRAPAGAYSSSYSSSSSSAPLHESHGAARIKASRVLPESAVWLVLADVAGALAHLHGRGMLHMDVKPDNVFVGDDGRLRLGDLGMAVRTKRAGRRGSNRGRGRGRGWGPKRGKGRESYRYHYSQDDANAVDCASGRATEGCAGKSRRASLAATAAAAAGKLDLPSGQSQVAMGDEDDDDEYDAGPCSRVHSGRGSPVGDEAAARHGIAKAHLGENKGYDVEYEGWGEMPTAGRAGRPDRPSAAPGTAVKSRNRNRNSRTDGPRILSFASGPHTQPRPRPVPVPGPGPAIGSSPIGRRALSGSMGPLGGGRGAARTLQLGGLPVTSSSERGGEERAAVSRSIRRIDTAALELEAEAALGLRGVGRGRGRGRGRNGNREAHAHAQVGMDDSAQFVDSDEAGTDSDSESDSGTEGGPEQEQDQDSGNDPGVLHVRRTASALNWSDSSDSDESSGDDREEEEDRDRDSNDSPMSAENASEGDALYMAPELLAAGNASPKADVFSLGVLAFELAWGLRAPAAGDAWHAIREHRLPPIPPVLHRCRTRVLANAVRAMLHPDPSKRPTARQIYQHPRVKHAAASCCARPKHASGPGPGGSGGFTPAQSYGQGQKQAASGSGGQDPSGYFRLAPDRDLAVQDRQGQDSLHARGAQLGRSASCGADALEGPLAALQQQQQQQQLQIDVKGANQAAAVAGGAWHQRAGSGAASQGHAMLSPTDLVTPVGQHEGSGAARVPWLGALPAAILEAAPADGGRGNQKNQKNYKAATCNGDDVTMARGGGTWARSEEGEEAGSWGELAQRYYQKQPSIELPPAGDNPWSQAGASTDGGKGSAWSPLPKHPRKRRQMSGGRYEASCSPAAKAQGRRARNRRGSVAMEAAEDGESESDEWGSGVNEEDREAPRAQRHGGDPEQQRMRDPRASLWPAAVPPTARKPQGTGRMRLRPQTGTPIGMPQPRGAAPAGPLAHAIDFGDGDRVHRTAAPSRSARTPAIIGAGRSPAPALAPSSSSSCSSRSSQAYSFPSSSASFTPRHGGSGARSDSGRGQGQEAPPTTAVKRARPLEEQGRVLGPRSPQAAANRPAPLTDGKASDGGRGMGMGGRAPRRLDFNYRMGTARSGVIRMEEDEDDDQVAGQSAGEGEGGSSLGSSWTESRGLRGGSGDGNGSSWDAESCGVGSFARRGESTGREAVRAAREQLRRSRGGI